MKNAMLEAALHYATEKHWPIFPVGPTKQPFPGTKGVIDATTDPVKIKQWWERWPNANIALDVGGASMMALDFDPGHDKEGLRVALGGQLIETPLRQRTPRGGEHWFYEIANDEVVSPSSSKLAPHVDVRSFHSYVLLAPSKTPDGAYTWEGEGKPSFRSDEMVRLSNIAREKHRDRDDWIIEPDLPENVQLAEQWLAKDAKIAIEGQGGDHAAYATAAMMRSFGLSEETALDAMWRVWNPRCIPPWGADEFDHFEMKVANGYAYCTSPPGNVTNAYHNAKAQVKFQPIVKSEGEGQTLEAGRFKFYDGVAMHHIKPPTWLVTDFIEERSLSMLYGARGVFKTFVALDIGMTLATGGNFPWDGLWQPTTQGPVLFAAGEGADSLPLRKAAWEHTHWGGKRVSELLMVRSVPKIASEKDLETFILGAKAMRPEGYALVVIDTLARSMVGLNENDTSDAVLWAEAMATIQSELNTAVLAIHHMGYGEKNQHRSRGNPVLEDAPDMVVRLERPDKASNIISLHMTKQRNGIEWVKPKFVDVRPVPELGSLAATTPKPNTIPKSQQNRKPNDAPLTDDEAAVCKVIDKAIVDELRKSPGNRWSQVALAEKLAMRAEIDLGSERLRTFYMKRVRENKATLSNKLYHSVGSKPGYWLWNGPG